MLGTAAGLAGLATAGQAVVAPRRAEATYSNESGYDRVNTNLHVDGALTVLGRIQSGDGSGTGGIWLSNGQNMFLGQLGANVAFYTSGVGWNALQIAQDGCVGIGGRRGLEPGTWQHQPRRV